jgi:predicted transposase/invertase (TIGR01784 family)
MPSASRYIDPKTDLAFKLVFGNDTVLLASFLNALLPLPNDAQIEHIEYLPPEQVPQVPGHQKRSILDVKCQDTKGRIFIVEMQMYWSGSFEKRIVFEASQAYVSQPLENRSYAGLKPVYALALTNTVFLKEIPEYYHHFRTVHSKYSELVLKGLEYVFIEIPKFKPTSHEEKRMAVKWLRFMSEVGNDDSSVDTDMLSDPLIAKALKIVEVAALNAEQLASYHHEQDKIAVEGLYAFDARAEGKAEGKSEGKAEGLAEGLAQGEMRAKAALIKAMHLSGMEAEQISRISGCSLAEVQVYLSAS